MYKHHNPTIAQPYLDELLEKLGSNWDDYTWGNNLCASIGCEYGHNKIIIVLIPNSLKDDIDNEYEIRMLGNFVMNILINLVFN